jgi:hypothetical protein
MGASAPITERRYVVPLALVTSLFFLWAIGVNLNDILIQHLKKAFGLTDFQSSLIQSAFFGGYFLAALPAGWLMQRLGYKRGILTGLLICATGAFLFIPAASIRVYGFFLFALFLMACGQSFLEVAANPYVTTLGPAESSERRLNLAQSFNAMGAVMIALLGSRFILSGIEHTPAELTAMTQEQLLKYSVSEANMVKTPYLVITGIFLFVALLIFLTKLPEIKETSGPDQSVASDVKLSGTLAFWAFDQRSSGPVFLCGRPGGCSELHHPLCRIHTVRHSRKGSSPLFAGPPCRLHDRALCRFSHHAESPSAQTAQLVCRRVARLSACRFARVGPDCCLGDCTDWVLPFHHVSHDLCPEPEEPGIVHETGIFPAGDVDYRGRGGPRHHGQDLGCMEYSTGVRGPADLSRIRVLLRYARL